MADKAPGGKKTFVLRVQPEVYAALEQWAADEFRSVNGQLEYLITDALRKAGRMSKCETPVGNSAPMKPDSEAR